MDNTIIRGVSPRSRVSAVDSKYSQTGIGKKYDPLPNIKQDETDAKNYDATGVIKSQRKEICFGMDYDFAKTPDNFVSILEIPKSKFEALSNSSNEDDLSLLKDEKECLWKMQKLEIAYVLEQRKMVKEGFEITLCKPAQEVINDTRCHHLYSKYFHHLKTKYLIRLARELAGSYISYVNSVNEENYKDNMSVVVQTGFNLSELLKEINEYDLSNTVLGFCTNYASYNTDVENWMALWEAAIKVMANYVENVQFQEADWAYHTAVRMAWRVKMMSFGQVQKLFTS